MKILLFTVGGVFLALAVRGAYLLIRDLREYREQEE